MSDINVTAVRLGTVPATWGNIDGNKLMVKFNRQTVIDYIWALKLYSMRIEWPYSLPKEGVEVMRPITGEFYNGAPFEGSGTIRVIYTVSTSNRLGYKSSSLHLSISRATHVFCIPIFCHYQRAS